MTTLVFGGTGFIGRRTIPKLVQAGEQVVVMDLNRHRRTTPRSVTPSGSRRGTSPALRT